MPTARSWSFGQRRAPTSTFPGSGLSLPGPPDPYKSLETPLAAPRSWRVPRLPSVLEWCGPELVVEGKEGAVGEQPDEDGRDGDAPEEHVEDHYLQPRGREGSAPAMIMPTIAPGTKMMPVVLVAAIRGIAHSPPREKNSSLPHPPSLLPAASSTSGSRARARAVPRPGTPHLPSALCRGRGVRGSRGVRTQTSPVSGSGSGFHAPG